MSDVNVVFRKYDGALHWHYPARRPGEEDYGVWLGISPPTVARRGTELAVDWTEPAVLLIPRSEWWTAPFCPIIELDLYCDVTTIPTWNDGMVTMVDLDLDVIRRQDGSVFLDDEDEFAEHQITYGYPPDVVRSAEASAQELLDAVRQREAPFGGAHKRWLAQVTPS